MFENDFVPQKISITFIYTYEVFIRRRLRRVLVRTRRVVGLNGELTTPAGILTLTFVQAIPRTVRATF